MREFLEKNYTDELAEDDDATVKLAIRALMEVVESGKNLEIALVRNGEPVQVLTEEEVQEIVDAIEAEKADEA